MTFALRRPKNGVDALTNKHLIGVAVCLMFMSGCAAPSNSTPGSESLSAATKMALDDLNRLSFAPSMPPPLQGIGYAVISVQPGHSTAHKTLLAIRVARMDAMRALAEQIHGLHIDSRTTIAEAVVQSDTLRATVSGAIRGAHTIRIEPHSSDTYEVVLEIDPTVIAQLLRLAGQREQKATENTALGRESEGNDDPNVANDENPNPVTDIDNSTTSTPTNFCGC